MSPAKPLLFVLASALLATALAGCTDGALTASGDGTWYATKGIQCQELPWEKWANEKGRKESGAEAQEPFKYDERRAKLMKAYYAETDSSVADTWAYYDDLAYPSVCGAASSWNYFVLATKAPSGPPTWAVMDKTPEEAAADREP